MKKYLLPLILILFLTFTLIGNCDWLSGWDKRIELSIGDYAGDIGAEVTWFPVTAFLKSGEQDKCTTSDVNDLIDSAADWSAQTFTPSSNYWIKSVLFDMYRGVGDAPGTVTVSITNTDIDGKPTGGNLTSGTVDGDTLPESAGTDTTITFASPYKVKNGIKYAIIIKVPGADVDNVVRIRADSTTPPYADGSYVYSTDSGSSWIVYTDWDFYFTCFDINPIFIELTTDVEFGKVAFTKADGTTELYAECEQFDVSEELGIYHISRDGWTINANTSIYMYYDKDHADNTIYIGAINTTAGGNVWDGNFKAVYHMVDATTSTIVDSTSNSHDGTKTTVNNPNQVTGLNSAYAQEHTGNDASNSDITITDHADFDAQSDFTIMAVVYCDTFGDAGDTTYECHVLCKRDATYNSWLFNIRGEEAGADAGKQQWMPQGGTERLSTTAISLSTWTQIGISFDNTAGNYTFYKNGAADGDASVDITPPNNGGDVSIGGGEPPNAYVHDWDGKIGEVRYSDTNRSAAWTKAEHNSLWDSLLTCGSEETKPSVTNVMFIFGDF